jgi:hypothetical protein
MDMLEESFDKSSVSRNREALDRARTASGFFVEIVAQSRKARLRAQLFSK